MPYTIYHIQYTIYHIPYTIYHTQYTIYHTPHTIYYIPHTTYHIPFTIYHITVKSQLPVAPRFATCTYDPYTKHNDENDNRFCSSIINIHSNPPLSNHGRGNVSHARMTYIPSTMMKIIYLSIVTLHAQS